MPRLPTPSLSPSLSLGVALFLALSATATQAQVPRYECRLPAIDATSPGERNQRAARRSAQDAWESRARNQTGIRYRWGAAQEVAVPNASSSQGGRWVARVSAYPCQLYVDLPRGTLETSETSASDRVCMRFPTLAEARQNNCTFFYPLRR
jgi:hypothetical protein